MKKLQRLLVVAVIVSLIVYQIKPAAVQQQVQGGLGSSLGGFSNRLSSFLTNATGRLQSGLAGATSLMAASAGAAGQMTGQLTNAAMMTAAGTQQALAQAKMNAMTGVAAGLTAVNGQALPGVVQNNTLISPVADAQQTVPVAPSDQPAVDTDGPSVDAIKKAEGVSADIEQQQSAALIAADSLEENADIDAAAQALGLDLKPEDLTVAKNALTPSPVDQSVVDDGED